MITSTHRAHAHAIAKGMPLKVLAAEILGKVTGCCKGRGGTMHLSLPAKGILYSSSIVGAGAPLAVGAALSAKIRNTNQVIVCFFGEGATNTGGFHESLNLASIWKLPIVFVCENNLYAVASHFERTTSIKSIADRAAAYNMPGYAIDGNNMIEIYRTALTAIERARKGNGPSLIVCRTYRWYGHCHGEPGTSYRTKEEIEKWMLKDPIVQLKTHLINESMVSVDELNKISNDIQAEIEEAESFAINSPFPSADDLGLFVF